MTELLGFDETEVPVYDSEANQDEMLTIMSALSNTMITLTRLSFDLDIWTSKDLNLLTMNPGCLAVSSFMPQKAHQGFWEFIRRRAASVMGGMCSTLFTFKSEPFQDVLPVLLCADYSLKGLIEAKAVLGYTRIMLRETTPNQDKMLANLKETYCGAVDLARYMVQQKGYGGRRAHRICATFVRFARDRDIPPYETTGKLLDEAAEFLNERLPGLSDKEVNDKMTFVGFFDDRHNVGDPHPDETGRIIALRRKQLAEITARQNKRKLQIKNAEELVAKEVESILNA